MSPPGQKLLVLLELCLGEHLTQRMPRRMLWLSVR